MEIEKLLSAAWTRFKDRALNYVLIMLLSAGVVIVAVASMLLLGGLIMFLASILKAPVVGGALIAVGALVSLLIIIYVVAWIGLAMTETLIQPTKLSISETFKKVRSYVWGYFMMSAMLFLFYTGVFPFSILTLFILLILWGFWGSFITFVYLEDRREGLDNLWVSRQMINQNFWGVVGRMVLLQVIFWFITYLLANIGRGSLSSIIPIFSFFSTPFAVCYNYEIYKNLKKPTTVHRPVIWVALSTIGWVLIIAALVFGIPAAMRSMQKLQPEKHILPVPYPRSI